MFLTLDEESVADAWIKAMQIVFFEGDEIKSQYDEGDDFPTRDCTSAIHVKNPESNPLVLGKKPVIINGNQIFCHAADSYCVESLKSGYIEEVMDGKKDHVIWEGSKSYPYTYHDRLFNYLPVNTEDLPYIIVENKEKYLARKDQGISIGMTFLFKDGNTNPMFGTLPVDQISEIVKQLDKAPYSRRAQAITWRPLSDNKRDDPPCLQRIWFRIFDGKLRMNTHWRSRDLFGAWGANVNGMIRIGKIVAKETGSTFDEYYDFCDSLHIYGKRKKVYSELVPMFDRIRNKEGLLKPEYSDKLDKLIIESSGCEETRCEIGK